MKKDFSNQDKDNPDIINTLLFKKPAGKNYNGPDLKKFKQFRKKK